MEHTCQLQPHPHRQITLLKKFAQGYARYQYIEESSVKQSETEQESPFVYENLKGSVSAKLKASHSKNMYFLSEPFLRTLITCGTDGILFPNDLRGMKRQMINKEDASEKIIISSLNLMSHSTCCSKVMWPQRCTMANL